jgi:hypothetical protein
METVADAHQAKKRLVFTCHSCAHMVIHHPQRYFFNPRLLLSTLELASSCPACGADNDLDRPIAVSLTLVSDN